MNIGESILIITDRYREKTGYCSLVIFREVFFVSEDHRKPETYRANLCNQQEFCASRNEQ